MAFCQKKIIIAKLKMFSEYGLNYLQNVHKIFISNEF